jgi:hypothetical protein
MARPGVTLCASRLRKPSNFEAPCRVFERYLPAFLKCCVYNPRHGKPRAVRMQSCGDMWPRRQVRRNYLAVARRRRGGYTSRKSAHATGLGCSLARRDPLNHNGTLLEG